MYFAEPQELLHFIKTEKIDSQSQLMLLVADKSIADLPMIMSFLNENNLSFFGGVYSGLLIGSKNLRTGFILEIYKPVFCSMALPYIMPMRLNHEDLQGKTAIVLVDGLSSQMKDLSDTIYRKLGSDVNYIGGGAGFYSMEHEPCIFDNNGTYKDVAYVCVVDLKVTIDIQHGWKKLQGPFTITKSNQNILSCLDGENAFDIYKNVIEDEERLAIYKEDFFMFAKDYPFGIVQKDGNVIVRDPISVSNEGDISCVADVPEESEVYVLHGNIDTLLESSMEIAEHCSKKASTKYNPLLFNCISRAMFMEERFEEELSNIQNQLSYTVQGALSIGEIASSAEGKIVIHNKSTVLGLLEVE